MRAFRASISATLDEHDSEYGNESDGEIPEPVADVIFHRASKGLPVTMESTLPMMSLPRSLMVWNVDFAGAGAAGFAGGAGGGT